MPVRDGERFLGKALESILEQTLDDFELIVVDDGSTDATGEILRSYADARLRVVDQPRLGLVAALNRGLGAARGRFLARMDADDISLPTRLERQLELLERTHGAGLAATWYEVIDEEGRVLETVVLPLAHDDLVRRLLLRNPFKHGSIMLRSEILASVGGYRDAYGANEDYDLWRRIAGRSRLLVVPEVLYRYREHGTGHSKMTELDRSAQRERLRDELWSAAKARDYHVVEIVRTAHGYARDDPLLLRDYVDDQWAIAREALVRGRLSLGTKALATAAVAEPSRLRKLGRVVRRLARGRPGRRR